MPPLRQNQFGGALGGPVVTEPQLFLRELRGTADEPLADAHVLGAVRRDPSGEFLGRSRRFATR